MLSELNRDSSTAGRMVTQFSDSIVVSYPVTETSGVFYLVSDVALLIMDLASRGFLARGAITHGRLIHTERYLVGPAMIRAYQMESAEAKVPRVVIDPEVLNFSRQHHAPQNSAQEEADYVQGFMTKDVDGLYFFDYVSWHSVVAVAGGSADFYGEYLRSLGALVERGLLSPDPSVLKKHLWLHSHYVRSIDQILNEPKNSDWSSENSEAVTIAELLDRHDEIATKARARVCIS